MSRYTSFFLFSSIIALATASTCRRAERCIAGLEAGRECPLLPMLPGTFAPPPGPAGFTLTTLRKGVVHYSDDAYHALILFSRRHKHLVVVDFPRSPNAFAPDGTYRLGAAVSQVLNSTVPTRVDMVYSHRHFDHIGFAGIFRSFISERYPNSQVFVWGTDEAKEFILRKEDTDVPLPDIRIRKYVRTIPVSGSVKLKLSILGGHTDSDVIAYVPPTRSAEGVVHFVDVITAGEAPFIQFTLTTDLGRYLDVHDKLLNLDFKFLSTGHGMIGDKNDVSKNKKFTEFVIDAARNAAQNTDPVQVGMIFQRVGDRNDAAYRNGAWALKSVLDLQVEICTETVIREWACRLSAVDVFAEGHCLSAALYNLVDL